MTKTLQVLRVVLLLALAGFCLKLMLMGPAHAAGHRPPPRIPDPVPSVSPSPSPSPSPSVTPIVAITAPQIIVGQITGATPQEIQMISEGVKLANQKIASDCFKQWVLAAKYTENNGLTQQQIWDLISTHLVSVDVEMYDGSWKANHVWKTIGYENDPYDGVVHMNRYFVNTAYMVADNLVHEGEGHSQGFHHYGDKSTSEPYGMNYSFEGCSEQMMQAKRSKAFKPPGIRLEIRRKKKGHGHG